MSIYLTGTLWVAASVTGGVIIGYLVRRYGLDEGRRANNDAAGQAFTIVGGLHAVIVAFALISLFDAAGSVRTEADREAQGLVDITWAAHALPEPAHTEIPRLAREYAETVAGAEWPRLREGAPVPDQGWTELARMRKTIEETEIPPDNDWLTDQKTEAAHRLTDLYRQRQARLDAVRDNNIGLVVWFVLIAGSVIFVLLPNLFGGTKQVTHIIIVSALAATTTLLLFAIYQLQNPFAGGAKVGPDAFEHVTARLA
ncbi:bestrophin-like domain [Amycolatopsis alkalitolerans]|uniref:DUF4239 domain-containing protein n=1 Tax=Amycolatopsis alkalitolerans TaxID=2547244 RepID=A0A5C4M542_9PSEU|nr:DUF4239 domain-containing protein [Amycolatopsis alkalitolerans]TNC27764.1 DUF4239 domain-containing protein [Amycolatopsis alkalitolerans]